MHLPLSVTCTTLRTRFVVDRELAEVRILYYGACPYP